MESVTTSAVDARGSNAYPDEVLRLPLSVRWKTRIDESGPSAPLKWRDRVVVTNNVYDGEPSTLYCVDAATGALQWRAAQTVIGMSDVGCLAGGVALYYTNNGLSGLNAYDILTGSLAWSRPDVTPGMPRLVAPGKVVICDRPQESAVEALDPLTGRTMWRAELPHRISSVAADERHVYVTERAIDPGESHSSSRLAALDLASGQVSWTADLYGLGQRHDLYERTTTPARIGGIPSTDGASVYCPLDGPHVACVNAENGGVRWVADLDMAPASALVLATDRLLAPARHLFQMDYATGARTGPPVPLRSADPERVWLSVAPGALVAERLYVFVSDKSLNVLDVETGKLAWERSGQFTSAIVSNGRIFAGSFDGHLYCFE
jgi:outer membrane protein assembly factor BamB